MGASNSHELPLAPREAVRKRHRPDAEAYLRDRVLHQLANGPPGQTSSRKRDGDVRRGGHVWQR